MHKNGDFGAISVTERSCASLISDLESHMSDRSSYYMYNGSLSCLWPRFQNEAYSSL